MTFTPSVANVLSVYDNAFPNHVAYGATWYHDAHDIAREIGGYRLQRAAGVISALSPMNKWDNNVAKARAFYAMGGNVVIDPITKKNGIGLSKSVEKANAIYSGIDALDVLTADKTRAFFLSIAEPDAIHAPVIDRHAFDIAIGMRTNDAARSVLSRKGMYAAFAGIYILAAKARNVSPSVMQATTWVAWREAIGIVD